MTSNVPTTPKAMLWAGRVIGDLPVLLMGGGAIFMSIAHMDQVVEGMTKYGYPARAARPLLIVEVLCALLYLIPQTAALGAILLTGYLGGAVATHVRAGEPFWMPILFATLMWLGLYLRDARLRALVPLRGL